MKIVDEHVVMMAQSVPESVDGAPITFRGYPDVEDSDEPVLDAHIGNKRITAEKHGDGDYRATLRVMKDGTSVVRFQSPSCSSPVVAVMMANCLCAAYRIS